MTAHLRQADPIASMPVATPDLEAALDEIAQAIVRQPRGPRRRLSAPRLRVAIVVTAIALLIGGGVAAGAGLFSAHTGIFPSKAETAMGGPGEALDPAAPDFRAVALQVASDIPYPAGYESWREFLIADEIRMDSGSGLVSTGALHGWFAASAFCAWVRSWRDAELAGDNAGAARAAQVVAQVPGWKAVTTRIRIPTRRCAATAALCSTRSSAGCCPIAMRCSPVIAAAWSTSSKADTATSAGRAIPAGDGSWRSIGTTGAGSRRQRSAQNTGNSSQAVAREACGRGSRSPLRATLRPDASRSARLRSSAHRQRGGRCRRGRRDLSDRLAEARLGP